ncbi:MAG: enoyl-CoA hydratase-related protein [Xanthobacteraceae bacterium]
MTYDDYKTIAVTRAGRILTLTMNRADKLNATDALMHEELSRIFYDVGRDGEADVVILTGAGKAFCAGGDTNWMQDTIDDPSLWRKTVTEAKGIIFGLLDLEKPVIAKLNGAAVGLGATIALYCDVIFASDRAKIGDPHVSVGFVAGDGGSAIWPQLVGYARAKEFLMTGDIIGAQTAADMGLINHCVPHEELDQRVQAFAERLAGGAIRAIQWTKMAINGPLRQIVSTNLEMSLALEGLSNVSADHQEGVRAFNEKRAPRFTGQ